MRCPKCQSKDLKVVESRNVNESNAVRRRRECLDCEHRFTTYERLEMPYMTIKKRDGTEQPYDRSKLISGIAKSCEKRPVSMLQIEALVSEIEQTIYKRGEPEVSSVELGEMVMDRLLEMDDVAYVRFASVYRSFADISSFEDELDKLRQRELNQKEETSTDG